MFKNYIKLALKVLGRRKFYTFVSLFGISFTLMVLMVIMAFLDTELGNNAPMSKSDRMIFVDRIELKTQIYDTIYQVDSQFIAGRMVYDTSGYETEEAGQYMSSGSPGRRLFTDYLYKVEPYERHTVMFRKSFDIFQDNRKFNMSALNIDEEYWNIMDFNFLAGKPFMADEVASAKSVAVISDKMAEEFFGSTADIIGKEIELTGRTFSIIGMVERPRASSGYTSADLYLPITTADNQTIGSQSLQGPFRAVFLANSAAEVPLLQENLYFAGKNVPIPVDMSDFKEVSIEAFTRRERYAWQLFHDDEPKDSLWKFNLALFGLLGFFLLIPTLNLINLNLSRMVERASEISVRKAFGADSKHILIQFLFENIIITLIGGIIGFILSIVIIQLINQSNALPNTLLAFNWRVAFLSLVVCLGFGFLSGLLPAYRMSRQHIADGL